MNRFLRYRDILSDLGYPMTLATRILDFGCGAGEFVREGRLSGYDIVGCDFEATGEHLAAIETPYRLPYPDRTFDVILSNQVFEHIKDYDSALAELRRVLQPGGVCLHIFPSRWMPIEPHVFVPLATVIHRYSWLYLWAALGIRNPYQAGKTASEVAKLNLDYLLEHTNYLPKRQLIKRFRQYFNTVRFAESSYLSVSKRGHRFRHFAALYSAFRERVLFASTPSTEEI